MKLSRDLNDLTEKVKNAAQVIVGVHPDVFITETGRSEAQQRENIAKGVSWTMDSMHMMKPKSRAFDIAFQGSELYPKDIERWKAVAKTAKECGMDWGYDLWKTDKPHFQCDGSTINENKMSTHMFNQMEIEVPKDLQIFNSYKDESPCSIGEMKALINIGLYRWEQKKDIIK